MDTQAKARYSALRERDWNILGYQESYYRLYEADLEGDIHPIFQYTVPGRSFPIWPLFSQQEYQSHLVDLGPVFRLATRILLSPSSLDFFYWLIYSPRTAVEPPAWSLEEPILEYRRDDTPEDYRRDESRRALDRFALTHRITFGELEEAAAETRAMFSFARDDQGINIMDDSPVASGLPSWIILGQRYLDQLARLRAGGFANRLKTLNLRFKMAVTLVHELAHALNNARNRKYLDNAKTERLLRRGAEYIGVEREPQEPVSNEDLFEDENSAETGYSWEAFVFGGRVELDHLDASNPLMFSKWPSFLGSREYLRRGGWKSSVTRYLVSVHYILNVNRQIFWDNIEPGDTTALYIQKMVGIRIPCPYPDIDSDWNASDSSEGKWATDLQLFGSRVGSHRVNRMKPDWIVEDPSTSRANESDEARLQRETEDALRV